jgi:hypothetical protein
VGVSLPPKPAVSNAIVARMAAAKSPTAAANYAELAACPGFQKARPTVQAALIAALDVAPADKTLVVDLELMATAPGFASLSPELQNLVVDRLRTTDATVRTHYSSLALSPGFAKLSHVHQAALVRLLDKHPSDEGYLTDLEAFVDSPVTGKLGAAQLSLILAGLDTVSPRSAVLSLATAKGFSALTDDEQLPLLRLVCGSSTKYSGTARAALAPVLAEKSFRSNSAEGQAETLRAFLDEQIFVPAVTTAPDGTFTSTRPAQIIHGPAMDGSTATYEVEIEGTLYPVIIEPAPSGYTHYTIDEIAKGLASVPKKLRENIQQVHLTKDVRAGAYMASNSSGVIWGYPDTHLAGQDFMASALVHEVGHIISNSAWGDDVNDLRWNAWKKAMIKDGFATSRYGSGTVSDEETNGRGSAFSDDFAEAILLYMQVKGTSAADEMRKLFPNRFELLDALCG